MKKIFFALFLTLTLSQCSDDFLDRSSPTQIAEDNFWTSESDAFLALNAVYSTLQSRSMYGGNLNGWQGFPGFDNLGDNAFNQFKWEGPGRFMEGTLDPANGPTEAIWNDLYQGIARVNSVIKNVEDISTELIPQETKKALAGQAYFLRALFYFNLAVYYEDVPLIIAPQTLGAALGLLARVQLYNKQYNGEDGVLSLTEQIIGLGYDLHPDYAELFTEAGEYSPEIVFSIRFLRGDDTNNGEIFSATFLGTPKVDQRPMPNLVNDYYCTDGLSINDSPLYNPDDQRENRDPRALATIYFKDDQYLDEPVRVFPGNGPTQYGMRKYIRRGPDAEGNAVFGEGSQDFYLIRYADVLLMRAEAMAETGDVDGATQLVNLVRARVNMPRVEDVEGAVNQAQMIDIVRHERRVELALEGLRFMDLKRWGTMEEAFQRASSDPVGPYNPQYLGGRSEVFPIPQSEIDVNPNLTQHPDW